ncbi:hypothetical protein KDK95_06480, partial [Actinospica sp. MGRD01-02]
QERLDQRPLGIGHIETRHTRVLPATTTRPANRIKDLNYEQSLAASGSSPTPDAVDRLIEMLAAALTAPMPAETAGRLAP